MLLSIISNIVMLRVTCCVSVLTCRWHTLWSSSSAARLLSPTSRSADLYSSSAVAAPPENTRRVESQSLFRTPELVKPNRGGLLRCWRRCGDPEWRQTSPGGPWNHTHPECSVFTGLLASAPSHIKDTCACVLTSSPLCVPGKLSGRI